jgi:putative membrane protein insertion efficiency factor
MSPASRILRSGISVYQRVRAGRPSPCRFDPSCSEYANVALERYGAVKGGALAIRRISRCHPWGGQGYDPVPDKKETLTCSR